MRACFTADCSTHVRRRSGKILASATKDQPVSQHTPSPSVLHIGTMQDK